VQYCYEKQIGDLVGKNMILAKKTDLLEEKISCTEKELNNIKIQLFEQCERMKDNEEFCIINS
jgi:hypothetical protein